MSRLPTLPRRIVFFMATSLWFPAAFHAHRATAADYTEIGSGDLSGDRLAPTSWTLAAGTNRLIATTSPGDQEYLGGAEKVAATKNG